MYGLLSILGWLALAASPAWTAQARECRPETPQVGEALAVADGIVAADNRGDIEAVLEYYSADAVLMPPGEAPVVGRGSIRPRYEALFADFAPAIEPVVEEVCAEGNLAFVRGRNTGRLVSRTSGSARTLDDVYLMLLRREADGKWRISHLIWHRQSPADTAPNR